MSQFERTGSISEPITAIYPQIIGGICEYCGVMDRLKPDYLQYTLCPHFKGVGEVRCSYCPGTANPIDVIKQRRIVVHGSPFKTGELIAVCDAYTCSGAHEKRFKRNSL